VPRTIARVNNPRVAWLFDGTFHVDVAVSQADILAGLIQEEMSLGDMTTLLKLRLGTYAVVEQRVLPGSRALGIEIKDLQLPEHCVIAAIVRNGDVIVPRGVTTFQVDDDVLAVTDRRGAQELAERLAPP
jgi:trk system potassium uptake protein TrkA